MSDGNFFTIDGMFDLKNLKGLNMSYKYSLSAIVRQISSLLVTLIWIFCLQVVANPS